MGLGWPEILIILLIIVVLFGARRIPELAKGLGEGIRNFKQGVRGDDRPELEERHYRDDTNAHREGDRKFRDEVDRTEQPRRSI